ncbi:MAG: DNA repair protein RecN [Alphaproteobacteria bacterium]|nr:DNA repair protein RecN [Alphaproteobacteria bacterium]
MLVGLSIRDVVLVDRLDLAFEAGLSVLTGETGAGKSILLDSLSLALGARADSGLVRTGSPQLVVTARFAPPVGHPVWDLLRDQGLECSDDDSLVFRRTVTADGRSRAFLNDQPVSAALLRQLGETLVEIHGQFDSHGLLNPATHLEVLDSFGGQASRLAACAGSWRVWRERARERTTAEAAVAQAQALEEQLRADAAELDSLAPKPGEEAQLAERRAMMMNSEKLVEAMNAAFSALSQSGGNQGGGVACSLRAAHRHLERIADKAGGRLDAVIAALDRAAIEIDEASGTLEKVSASVELDSGRLEQMEERLFALRAAARRHGTDANGLVALRQTLHQRLAALEDGGGAIARLVRTEQAARAEYVALARDLSRARAEAATRLDQAVNAELPPLKLSRASFHTRVTPLAEAEWSAEGLDRVVFEVATNPGTVPGPLGRIASGGELARFMLALKVILAGTSRVPSLIFDEVDTGIGGATADAVGHRLARLAATVQVLVVTHSPQVAARAHTHLRVEKRDQGGMRTVVETLAPNARREEIARMLAGAAITDEARAAADRLMAGEGR